MQGCIPLKTSSLHKMASIQCKCNCISYISICLKNPRTTSSSSKFSCLAIASTPKVNERVDLKQSTITIEELKDKTRKKLKRLHDLEPMEGMKLIDNLQWLGIGYHFEDETELWLERVSEWECREDDLHATALRFRLLRQQLRPVSCDIFQKFMEEHKNKKFQKSMIQDEGLLNLYEASYLAANGEDILSEAMKFTETRLASSVKNTGTADDNLSRQISRALELPRHHRMVRLESRRYIEDCSTQIHRSSHLLELAKLDYNNVQSLHKMELAEFRRWWKQLGLVGKLSFARDPEAECFFWAVGIFPDPRYSGVRMEIAKTVAILIIIDDVFDKYGTIDDLSLFTLAVQRWDVVDAIENLPDYMKIIYMALYNTTTEIAQKILKEHGINVIHFLARAWIDTIEAYMNEAKWFQNGQMPSVDDYIENAVTTGGSYMALVHAFFLMGEGITNHNIQFMRKPYPKLFSTSGRILRLWDDLGTSKEEQDFGDNASLIPVLMKEKNLSEDEAREYIKQLIRRSWREMNTNLLDSGIWPLSLINVCLNMCRTSQAIYHHQEYSYLSSFKRTAKIKLLEPITN